MINHIVLFKFKKSLPEADIQHLFDAIQKLSQLFPGIKNFSWGRNNNNEGLSHGFEYGLFLQFDSAETRFQYQTHPMNKDISERLVIPALADGMNSALVFDYDTEFSAKIS